MIYKALHKKLTIEQLSLNIILYVYIFPICLYQLTGPYSSIQPGPSPYNIFVQIHLYDVKFISGFFESLFREKIWLVFRGEVYYNKQFTALRSKWQFMDRSVTHKILCGPQLRFGPYSILWVISRSINCHMALSPMNYLLNMSDMTMIKQSIIQTLSYVLFSISLYNDSLILYHILF